MTLLSGFLGAGKTTLLKHLLENKAGLRVGVIVNDVAEVNIDAALVAVKNGQESGGTAAQEDTVEMANGCVCCSAAEELLSSIDKLMNISEKRSLQWDHIVIETSGVAEPREVRDNLSACHLNNPELLRGTVLHTMVTVVDASTFLAEYQKRNKVEQRSDLGASEFTDGNRQVVDLMCEQIECADILLANKTDLVGSADELALLKETLASLNPNATLMTSERGRVELKTVLGAAGEHRVAKSTEDEDLRRHVEKLKEQEAAPKAAESSHDHADKTEHGHGHDHDEKKEESHGHEHDHVEGHGHGHAHGADCDADCGKDDGAKTQHSHDHNNKPEGRESKRFGITSFVYQRRKPFHPHRLMSVIRQLPVRQETLALDQALKNSGSGNGSEAAGSGSPLLSLIRSKGFIWLSNSHPQMFYWALAGKHFELKQYASWWSCVPDEEWPEDEKERATIMKDYQGKYGDHRQELVFIGVKMDREAIIKAFDACLLSDSEMEAYEMHWNS